MKDRAIYNYTWKNQINFRCAKIYLHSEKGHEVSLLRILGFIWANPSLQPWVIKLQKPSDSQQTPKSYGFGKT